MNTSSSAEPKKSFLDNITIVINLLVVLFGSFSGAYWSNLQRDREITISEVQTLEKFMPYLIGEKGGANPELAKENSIVAIASLNNLKLALSLAELNPSRGSILALKNIATAKSIATANQTEEAIDILQKIANDQGYLNEVRSALLSISQQGDTHIAKKANAALNQLNQINQTTSTVVNVTPSNTPPQTNSTDYIDPWVIQAGSDTTLEGAKYEVQRASSFANKVQIYKKGNWYVTTIGRFSNYQSAQDETESVKNSLNRAVFVVNLNTFCPKNQANEISISGYIQCPDTP